MRFYCDGDMQNDRIRFIFAAWYYFRPISNGVHVPEDFTKDLHFFFGQCGDLITKQNDEAMRLACVTPFEEQATKWTPQLRERYFDMLADCTDLSCVDYQETPNAQLMAYRRIIKQSDMLMAVYDPELAGDSAEDKAMAYALALGKPTLLIYPDTWKKKWLNVVKREGE